MILGSLYTAYIDPGTGSLLIQGLVAAFVAASVAVGAFFSRIKGALRSMFNRKPNEDAN